MIILLITGCDTRPLEPLNPQAGSEYFPLEKGRFVSYNVRQTIYRLNQPPEVVSFQLKEVVSERYITPAGEEAWQLVRYRRANGRQNWEIINVWTVRKTATFAMRTEENVPFLRLVFPISVGKTWNGNQYNTLGRENYRITSIGKSHMFDGKPYNQTLTVLHRNDSTLVGKDKRMEIYAPNIGLIYRLAEQVAYCQTPNCIGRAIIESGTVTEQSIFDSGIEPD
ncbi:MAG: hypothetical protein RMJ87_02515 [Cytophagales bacterium]|nr:hypothetical protein [Bernardetiaceae bacterium]MDW8203879.1 hypothetical protein [Cytophagales bacterium]